MTPAEAHRFRVYLEAHDIPAAVTNENLHAALPEVPIDANSLPNVVVAEQHADRAREIIGEAMARARTQPLRRSHKVLAWSLILPALLFPLSGYLAFGVRGLLGTLAAFGVMVAIAVAIRRDASRVPASQ